MTRWRKLWLYALGALLIVVSVLRYHAPEPRVRGAIQTESFELGTNTAPQDPIPLHRAFLYQGDTIPLANVWLAPEVGAHLRFTRMSPETLSIRFDARGASAGCIEQELEDCILPLDKEGELHVLLPSGGEGAERVVYRFRAKRIRAGEIAADPTGRVPLVRSGEVLISDRTVSGRRFTSASRTLRMGDAIGVAYRDTLDPEEGVGTLIISDEPGMTVSFYLSAPSVQVFYGDSSHPELVSTPRFSRYRNDLWVGWLSIAVSYLLLQPFAERLRAWVNKRFAPGGASV